MKKQIPFLFLASLMMLLVASTISNNVSKSKLQETLTPSGVGFARWNLDTLG